MARMQHRVAPAIGSGGASLLQCIRLVLLLIVVIPLLIISIVLFLPPAWESEAGGIQSGMVS